MRSGTASSRSAAPHPGTGAGTAPSRAARGLPTAPSGDRRRPNSTARRKGAAQTSWRARSQREEAAERGRDRPASPLPSTSAACAERKGRERSRVCAQLVGGESPVKGRGRAARRAVRSEVNSRHSAGGRRGAARCCRRRLLPSPQALPARSGAGRAGPARARPPAATTAATITTATIPPLPSRCRRPPAATMQELIASVDHIKFDLELAVEQQLGAQPLPFPGMDSACGHRALRGSFFPGVLGAGSWCLGRGCVCGVCV